MKRKGFTLIELLAVIVILAVIALIAVPIITNVIEKAKIGSAENSVSGYVDAAEKTIMTEITKGNSIDDGEYDTSDDSVLVSNIKYKGTRVTGTFTLTKKQITSGSFCVDKYSIDYDGKKAKYNKDANYCSGEILKGTPIGTVTQNLLSSNSGNTYTYMNGEYLKGVQDSNYVWYNGFLWRIMGKNEDGSVRLITEENVTAIPYVADKQGLTYSSNTGYLNDWLNDYFYNNLDSSKTSIIKTSDWCINVATSRTSKRIDCTGGTTFNAKVGLVTLDEYNLSGASYDNQTYGLVNSQTFWTLTPYNVFHAWSVDYLGDAFNYSVTNSIGARPVINVDTTATITSGNGTLQDAYILNQTTSNKTGKLNDNASSGEYVSLSGEYVSLSGKTYRVVSKDSSIGTKLIYDGYYEEVSGTPTMMTYNPTSTNVFSKTTGIGQKLNGDVLTWLGNSDKIVPTSWYQTSGFGYGTPYTAILNDTSNPIIDTKVGLIRVGEMMSGVSASILTKNYTVRSAYGNAKDYWTMNKDLYSPGAWYVYIDGSASNYDVTYAFGARPVIYVNTSTTITEGNGTLQSPYIID